MKPVKRVVLGLALTLGFAAASAASAPPASADVPTIGSCFRIGPGGVQGSWGAGWHDGGLACTD